MTWRGQSGRVNWVCSHPPQPSRRGGLHMSRQGGGRPAATCWGEGSGPLEGLSEIRDVRPRLSGNGPAKGGRIYAVTTSKGDTTHLSRVGPVYRSRLQNLLVRELRAMVISAFRQGNPDCGRSGRSVRKIQAGKITKTFLSSAVVSARGFYGALVNSEIDGATLNADFCGPASVFSRPGDALEPAGVAGAKTLIAGILPLRADPKVGAMIVQGVVIDVVNDIARLRAANQPMHPGYSGQTS